ncbi:hypothetical protein MUK42_17728 [Musa troglodytarum]|uniref:Uncharacterized protein n=1 Tax=Musa troglodytarum TaxID=320322 RepID=A0A9E7KXC2_9LILI|nr:hypothetical protein MUK42_17728 [Musa troglodytarum]
MSRLAEAPTPGNEIAKKFWCLLNWLGCGFGRVGSFSGFRILFARSLSYPSMKWCSRGRVDQQFYLTGGNGSLDPTTGQRSSSYMKAANTCFIEEYRCLTKHLLCCILWNRPKRDRHKVRLIRETAEAGERSNGRWIDACECGWSKDENVPWSSNSHAQVFHKQHTSSPPSSILPLGNAIRFGSTGSHRLDDGDRPCLMVPLRHPPKADGGSTGELIPTVPSSSSRAMTRSARSYRKATGAGAPPAITRLGVDTPGWWACQRQLLYEKCALGRPCTHDELVVLSLSLSLLTLITFSSWTSAGVRTAAMRRLGGLALMAYSAGFGATCAVDGGAVA